MQKTERRKRQGVMLAFPVDEKRLDKMPGCVYMQPKLNGERCKAEWNEELGYHVLKSSSGIPFKFLQHIEYDLRKPFKGVSVDGELYFHGWSREKIHSIVSRKTTPHKDVQQMEYHAFDLINKDVQMVRMTLLQDVMSDVSLKILRATKLYKRHLHTYTVSCVEDGYEGAIIRNPFGFYEEKRSNNLLKFKPEKTDRYLIVGTKREVDKYGEPKNALGAILVKGSDGTDFYVGSGAALTKEARESLWLKRNDLPGKWARVKHSIILTVNGAPTCTSLVSIEY